MSLKVFSADYFEELCRAAVASIRKRQHRNIHESFADPCQRFFNAICVDSYIRPHRHGADLGNELLIGVRGLMAVVTYDDQGRVVQSVGIGVGTQKEHLVSAVEVLANTWHTVIALQPGSVLLEVKAGPFDPKQPKEFAPWAPEESSPEVAAYLKKMTGLAQAILTV